LDGTADRLGCEFTLRQEPRSFHHFDRTIV
jgi:hypothetical protein